MKPWLDEYPDGDLHGLLRLEGEYRIDSLVCMLEQRIDLKENRTDEDNLILSICSFDREVNNGGFEQYLVNSSREFAHRLVGDLNRIDLERVSRKVLELYALMGLSDRPGQESVSDLVDSEGWEESDAMERLEEFDDYYFDTIGDCSESLWRWVKNHADAVQI